MFSGQVLKEKDTDGDEELSFQEYVGDRGQGKDKEWLISEKERFWKKRFSGKTIIFPRFDSELDKNGDSSLNTEEILAWIIPSNEEIATDEVNLSLFVFGEAKMLDILSWSFNRWITCSLEQMRMGTNSSRSRRFCLLRINNKFITEYKTLLQVLNNHDLFVGSEATDYGDHLHNLHKWEFKLLKTCQLSLMSS